MLERRWCVEAGLGFIGKNHQFIHPTLGSLVHLGEILLNVEVEKQEIFPIYVDVKGSVSKPGVYMLDSGSRVIDAIKKAGNVHVNSL